MTSETGKFPPVMDSRSEENLLRVHPDLVAVLRATSQSPQPFLVDYGLRQFSTEQECLASGHSETLHSRHLSSADGLCRAVDVAALTAGAVDWAAGRESTVYGQIATQVLSAAKALGVDVDWGGAPIGAWKPGEVSHFRDWGHFQLSWENYP